MYEKLQAIKQRALCMPSEADWAGARILVTGGTGCIGTALMAQLTRQKPELLASYSRGDMGYPKAPGAEYFWGDVRDADRLDRLVKMACPDVIFHTAAQRDPGLAEVEVHRTVTTNILGTRNVLNAARRYSDAQVVLASTGKAMRPYSPHVYTATKRAAEWLGVVAASDGLRVSAARFTHVIDNSIILGRLYEWARANRDIRLHGTDITFYVQSALESAQLMLIAARGQFSGEFRVYAINDLGSPLSLPAIAEGVLAELNSASQVCVTGYDQGYEEEPYPGLYDPMNAGGLSPLLNSFEAAVVTESPCPMVDAFPLQMTVSYLALKQLHVLQDLCRCTADAQMIRQELNALSWLLLDDMLAQAQPAALKRSVAFTEPHYDTLSDDYRRLLAAIKRAG